MSFLITLLPFRPELDACDSPEKYPQLFHVILDVEVEGVDKQKDLTPPWEQFPCKDLNPIVLFSCHEEHQEALAIAGTVWINSESECVGGVAYFTSVFLLCLRTYVATVVIHWWETTYYTEIHLHYNS